MNRQRLRMIMARWGEDPGARFLRRLGLTPNGVTLIGFALGCLSGYLVAIDELLIAGIILIVSGIFDMLDGSLARLTGKVSKAGALLDSVLDRLGEFALLLGILVLGLTQSREALVILAFLAGGGSFIISYIRARSEGLGLKESVGLATRPERILILSVGLLSGFILIATALLVAVSYLTAIHRFFYSLRGISKLE